jgi:hypothetical protein
VLFPHNRKDLEMKPIWFLCGGAVLALAMLSGCSGSSKSPTGHGGGPLAPGLDPITTKEPVHNYKDSKKSQIVGSARPGAGGKR